MIGCKNNMKRFVDIFISTVILLILSPIFIIISLLVFTNLGRPIFFSQKRAGFQKKPFKIYKFRTMLILKDSHGKDLEDFQRLTKFSKFLRSTSLDELPELINVIKGEMSLVGPRPLLIEYLDLYNDHQLRRFEAKPGITGLAQVNGRNNITWDEKFNFDVSYVDNRNLLLDFKILFRSIKKVIIREGISYQDHSTMDKFAGNEKK